MSDAAVVLATPDQERLVNDLLSAYLAELGIRSAYRYLPLYWQEPERFPYVIISAGELVGFALVREVGAVPQFEMSEFYVVPSHRRKGIGREAALQLFEIHCGSWLVSAVPSSAQAQAFWASVLASRPTPRRSPSAHVA